MIGFSMVGVGKAQPEGDGYLDQMETPRRFMGQASSERPDDSSNLRFPPLQLRTKNTVALDWGGGKGWLIVAVP